MRFGRLRISRLICKDSAPIPKAANWAVGGFVLLSLGSYEYCQAKRREEKFKLKRITEVYDQRQAEARRQAEEARKRKQEDQEAAARKAAEKRWYKFW